MRSQIGDVVKAARQARGWDQAQLAERVGVGQQAVSRWERGMSQPRKDLLPRLAQVLDIEPAQLRAASNTAPAGGSGESGYPAPPRVQNLPLAELPPDRFESFVADFVQLRHQDWTVRRYGSQGHKQHGIDVIAEQGERVVATLQCKRVRDFGPEAVRRAVATVDVDADQHYLVLARPTASPRARDEIRRRANWQLWDGDYISRMVRYDLDPDSKVRLIDTYFPGMREPFLGISEPGPWLSTDEFFAQFRPGQMFSHEWPLVGRQDTLDDLRSFAVGDLQLGVLVGRGGIGKTRLLRELAATVPGVEVRFVAASAEVRPEHLDFLPSTEQLLIVIDDAHERSDITDIVAGVGRTKPHVKLLLATRPYGVPQLSQQLRRAGVYMADYARWDLSDLNPSEAGELAHQIAEPGVDRHAIDRLATLTADCPLITVLGTQLINRGQLTADRLESDESIRTQILLAFRDAFIADPLVADPDTRRAVLDAVSILQPFRMGDPAFHLAMEQLTGLPFDRAKHHLRALEEGGVLLRRGTSLRIVPDLLGDVILGDSCLDATSGATTGYLDRVCRAVEGVPRQHVFVNASRVDWQLRQYSTGVSLVPELWDTLDRKLHSSAIVERRELLGLVKKMAVFQPDQALRIVRWAINNPTDKLQQEDHPLLELYRDRVSYVNVLRDLPPILREVAYDFEHLPQVMDLLWQLAQPDPRLPHQDPDHPIRVLQDIAAFETRKPIGYNHAVVEAARRWFGQPGPGEWLYSPFDILEPMLATEGMSHQAVDPLTITITRFSINADVVRPLRNQVLELAFDEARSTDPRRAIRAIDAIAAGLRYPVKPKADEATWTPAFVEIIERLGELAQDMRLDPIIIVAIRKAISWHTTYSPTQTKGASREVIDRLPTSLTHDLALLLYDGWGHVLFEDIEDHHVVEQMTQARYDELTKRLIDEMTVDERLDLLAERLQVQQNAMHEGGGSPEPFVWRLLSTDAELARRICEHAEHKPDSVLVGVLSVALGRLAEQGAEDAIRHAERLLAIGSVLLARQVANAFGWGRGNRDELIDGEMELLKHLATHDDPTVRKLTIWAIQAVAKLDRYLAIDLMANVRFDDSADVAEELFSVFGRQSVIKWSDVPASCTAIMLEQLMTCPAIDGYHVTAALSDLSEVMPDDIVALLKNRVERHERERPSFDTFEVLPYHWHNDLKIRNHPRRIALLRDVRDWIAQDPNAIQARLGGDLFRAIAGTFDDAVLDVLDEAVRSGTREQLDTLTGILRAAPRTLVWTRVDFVARALDAAQQHGDDYAKRIGGALHAALSTGVRRGTPGEPFSEDIEQRDRATVIAAAMPVGSLGRRFYESLAEAANQSIEWHSEDDAALLDGRDW